MTTNRSFARCAAVAAALAGAATAARAQGGQLLYEWQGRVDHEVQIFPGRGGYQTQGIGGQENPGRFGGRVSPPRGQGQIYVQKLSGRGPVDVINGGTVRIRDPQGGADFYRVRVFLQPAGGAYGRGDGRRDDRDRRDRDRQNNGQYDDGRGRRPY